MYTTSTATTERISVKFGICDFYENKSRKSEFGSYRTLYMKTWVFFIFVGDVKFPQKRPFRVKWFQAVRVGEEI